MTNGFSLEKERPANSQQQSAARLGRAGELLVGAWFLLRHDVWVSIMPDASSVDMLVQRRTSDRILRMQIKATYARKGRTMVNLAKTNGDKYTAEEIDYVVAVDVEQRVFWVLPVSLAGKFTRLTLDERYVGYRYGWFDRHVIIGG